MKKTFKESFDSFNMKTECFVIIISLIVIILYYIKFSFVTFLEGNLISYFSQEVKNGITSFFSITVGIYIAVVTIISTSVIGISKAILQRKLDHLLISIIIGGMSEGLVAVGLSVFCTSKEFIYFWLLATVVIIAIISFVKFIRLLLLIFRKNLEIMARTIDDDENYKNDLLTHIEEISGYCRKNKKD